MCITFWGSLTSTHGQDSHIPRRFLWGAAFSAHQTEGGNDLSDWYDWEQTPGHIAHGHTTARALDHWHRYNEDFDLAQNMGLNSVRLSLAWSRIEPQPGVFDAAALAHYRDVIMALRLRGLTPVVCLHHFAHPRWFHGRGGWLSTDSPTWFANYVHQVAATLGALVPIWITFNEPMVTVVEGYLKGNYPPGLRNFSNAVTAYTNIVRAHALAAGALRQFRAPEWEAQSLPYFGVGITLNMHAFYPEAPVGTPQHIQDSEAVSLLENLYGFAFLEATQSGRFQWRIPPLRALPQGHTLDTSIPQAIGSLDWVGINYYNPWIIARDPSNDLGVRWITPPGPQTDLGWVMDPQGLLSVLQHTALHISLPLVVSENGLADRHDTHRARFIEDHVRAISQGRRAGLDIRGYYYWSLTDNFEWLLGFEPRFGLVEIDYNTLARHPRPSSLWFRQFISQGDP